MITNLQGEVIENGENYLVVMVSGIGFRVAVPGRTSDAAHIGVPIFLYTSFIVREDALSLYGFSNVEEREYFELLLGVNGIGPRLALMVISTLNVDTIRRAVFQEQHEIFSRVPGVGKKNAQKIILHLQGKLKPHDLEIDALKPDSVDSQLMDALIGLGYSVVEAQAALQGLPRNAPESVEERLRLVLQQLS